MLSTSVCNQYCRYKSSEALFVCLQRSFVCAHTSPHLSTFSCSYLLVPSPCLTICFSVTRVGRQQLALGALTQPSLSCRTVFVSLITHNVAVVVAVRRSFVAQLRLAMRCQYRERGRTSGAVALRSAPHPPRSVQGINLSVMTEVEVQP